MVPTCAPARARSARYPVTVAAAAGIGTAPWMVHQALNSRQSERYPRSVFDARAASTYPASSSVSGTPSSNATGSDAAPYRSRSAEVPGSVMTWTLPVIGRDSVHYPAS